jgi:hypothetical protein
MSHELGIVINSFKLLEKKKKLLMTQNIPSKEKQFVTPENYMKFKFWIP